MLYLFANVNFKPDGYTAWQAAYDKLAEYVYANEPTTQTYYFGIPFDYAHDIPSTNHMFAFEAYNEREDLYKTHFHSPAMKQFLQEAWPSMLTGFDLQHYTSIGGSIDTPGDLRDAEILHDTRIVCKSPEARARVSTRLARLADGVVKDKGDAVEKGVYTFMGFECLDNELDCRILGRWRSRADMERFVREEVVGGFWEEGKEGDVERIEARGYVPNGKGWLHR